MHAKKIQGKQMCVQMSWVDICNKEFSHLIG